MTAAALTIAGVGVAADLSGALILPGERTLVVADLHLEKGSSLARRGALLPPYDSRETLAALAQVIGRYRPERVICLGDSFHDGGGPQRLPADERRVLEGLVAAVDWVWVAGNHDGAAAAGTGGRSVEEMTICGLAFRHEARSSAGAGHSGGEISGHFHPKASVRSGGRRLTARCFVSDGRRLILPAFGAFTGGLDVFDPAIRGLLGPAFTAHLLGRQRVHSLAAAALEPRR